MTESITFATPGKYPPIKTDFIELDVPPALLLATDKSPKSVASPVEAMVIKSILF